MIRVTRHIRIVSFIVVMVTCLKSYGQFSVNPDWSTSQVYNVTDLVVADFNNDGNNDLLVASVAGKGKKTHGKVSLFLQKNGTLPQQPDREFKFKFPRGLAAGDFDEDGKIDFAVAEVIHLLYVFLGKDNFSQPYKNRNTNQFHQPVRAARLLSSSKIDFICGPVWRSWEGSKNFKAGYVYPQGKDSKNRAVIISDLNGDGVKDLIYASKKNNIRVYLGPFSSPTLKPMDVRGFYDLPTPVHPVFFQVVDINNDSLPDIVFSHNVNSKPGVMAYIQNRFEVFAGQKTPVTLLKGLTGSLAASDFNGDGIPDLIIANGRNSRPEIRVFMGTDKGLINSKANSPAQKFKVKSQRITFIKTADINGDKRTDLIVACPSRVWIFFNRHGKK